MGIRRYAPRGKNREGWIDKSKTIHFKTKDAESSRTPCRNVPAKIIQYAEEMNDISCKHCLRQFAEEIRREKERIARETWAEGELTEDFWKELEDRERQIEEEKKKVIDDKWKRREELIRKFERKHS